MRIETEIKLDFKDVLIRPKRSTLRSRSEVDLLRTFTFKHCDRPWTGVPIIASNMDTVGTFEMARVLGGEHKMIVAAHKFYSVEEWKAFYADNTDLCENHIAVSAGTSDRDFVKVSDVIEACPKIRFICLDIANGYSQHFVDTVKKVRSKFPKHIIIAGNVVTGEMTEELLIAGADIVKIGIGPGSVCTTRKQTGVGYPQLSATIECSDAAHGLGGLIIADGGCSVPGDIAKAFGGGADFVMLGGMLAAHDESRGQTVTGEDGRQYKEFYGMSSEAAMTKHSGGVASYRSAEGKKVLLLCRGPVSATCSNMLGGIRSACTYVGAARLKELSKRTTFVRVSAQLNNVFGKTTGEK